MEEQQALIMAYAAKLRQADEKIARQRGEIALLEMMLRSSGREPAMDMPAAPLRLVMIKSTADVSD